MSEREATSASKESILKALNVLNDKNTTNISLSSKIDFLEKKGLSSSDVLDALKLASTTGALNLAGGSSSLKQGWLWTTVAPWVAVVTVGLLTSYFTGDCGDEDSEDGSNNDPLIAAMPSESILGQEVVSSDDVSSTEAIKVDKSDEPEWATKVGKSTTSHIHTFIFIYVYIYKLRTLFYLYWHL